MEVCNDDVRKICKHGEIDVCIIGGGGLSQKERSFPGVQARVTKCDKGVGGGLKKVKNKL